MWLDAVQNAEAVNRLYESAPSLERIWIYRVELRQDGPMLVIHIHTKDLPSQPPIRWRSPYNIVGFELQLLGAEGVELKGWGTSNVASIAIRRLSESEVEVSVAGNSLALTARCAGLVVRNFTPILSENDW